MSQWGEIKHSDSRGFCQKYNVYKIIRAAKCSVSWHSKSVTVKGASAMEQYVKKPAAVQVFALNGATDIILRKDIASEKITDEEGNKQTVWNCEERQIRVASAVTEEEVTADFDSWWDYQPPREAEPVTASDRLDALEAAVYDLAEVVYNG